MQLTINYSVKEKIKSLSKRIAYSTSNTRHSAYVDKNIKSENLQYNLSLLLSHIILKIDMPDRSKASFFKIIDAYNLQNNTNLKFEDFKKINWIRVVADEVLLPELIRHLLWNIEYSENRKVDIPENKEHISACLKNYYNTCFYDYSLTIKKSCLLQILKNHSVKNITVDWLLEKEIIAIHSNTKIYIWKAHNYIQYLGDEIIATLWLLIGGKKATEKKFKIFFKYINRVGLWTRNIENYLSEKNIAKISEHSMSFFNAENDFQNTDVEFEKIWFDAPRYTHRNINTPIPEVKFDYKSPYDFITSIEYHESNYPSVFDHQSIRSVCHLLFNIMIVNEKKEHVFFGNFIEILQKITHTPLIWILYEKIRRDFSILIPYLQTNLELIPIAFKLIDDVEINQDILKEQSDRELKFADSCELKNSLWFEMLNLTFELLTSNQVDVKIKGEVLSKILIDLSKKVFISRSHRVNGNTVHNSLDKRYRKALETLKQYRVHETNSFPIKPIKSRFVFDILPAIIATLIAEFYSYRHYRSNLTTINLALIDVSVEFLKICDLKILEKEVSEQIKTEILASKNQLISALKTYLKEFQILNEVSIDFYEAIPKENRIIKRGYSEFGLEIIDWGYLLLLFKEKLLLQSYFDIFKKSIVFNTASHEYDDQNIEVYHKIKHFLKVLMLGFVSINKNKDKHGINNLQVASTLHELELEIIDLSLTYSSNQIDKGKIDAFGQRFDLYTSNLYFKSLLELLYESINYFETYDKAVFSIRFFEDSNDVSRMLSAVNRLDSTKLKKIISDRINNIDIKEFLDTVFSFTNLQNTLIEAVNSDYHWELATPLIEEIQRHLLRINKNDFNTQMLLFEVSLLLAFKENDFKKLINIPIPKKEYSVNKINTKGTNLKQFFIAIFNLYNTENYVEAIEILKSLLTNEVKNIRFAFHLYRAETLQAFSLNNTTQLKNSKKDWNDFVNRLSAEEKNGLVSYSASLTTINIYHYASSKDSIKFDQIINTLIPKDLYYESFIEIIYNHYINRGLHVVAFDYLIKAQDYYSKNEIELPSIIEKLRQQHFNEENLNTLKITLGILSSISAENIPKVLPNNLNREFTLNLFILEELIQASRVMMDKIESIRQITGENRFNDLLVAILKLRFPIWGWNITDQSRIGISAGGKDAGSADIVIESSGNQNIALLEGLILRDKDYTEEHILRCYKYSKSLDLYFMVVYILGKDTDFTKQCNKYKKHIKDMDYPSDFSFSKTLLDITSEFKNVGHLQILKSISSDKKVMYHLIVNLIR
ncbi:hypothetical protein [Kordia sp.]|uniref:hypothetical protein n=1 Tax=Kordia sp. TaxID=1965332 RepID=UPI003D26A393